MTQLSLINGFKWKDDEIRVFLEGWPDHAPSIPFKRDGDLLEVDDQYPPELLRIEFYPIPRTMR